MSLVFNNSQTVNVVLIDRVIDRVEVLKLNPRAGNFVDIRNLDSESRFDYHLDYGGGSFQEKSGLIPERLELKLRMDCALKPEVTEFTVYLFPSNIKGGSS